jgi:hypothetical protein
MAIAYVNSFTENSETSGTVEFGYNSTAGNTLIAIFYIYYTGNSFPSSFGNVEDSAGNTWTFSTTASQNPPAAVMDSPSEAGGWFGPAIAWCINAAAVTTISLLPNTDIGVNAYFQRGIIMEFSGIGSADNGAAATGNQADDISAPAITLGNSGDLVVGFIGCAETNPTALPNGWTSIDDNFCGYGLPGVSGSYVPTWTASSSGQDYAVVAMSFKPAGVASHTGALLGMFP